MPTRKLMLAATAIACPCLAAAQPVAGPYVSLGGGVNLQQNEIVGPAPSLGFDNKVIYTFQPGFAGKASAGYGLGNGFRAEIEGDYISNVVRGAQGLTNDGLDLPRHGGGLERKYGGFVNVLYDLNLGLPFQPYVGVGAGGLAVEHTGFNQGLEGVATSPPAPIPGGKPFGFHDQTIGGFAYQGIAGAAVPLGWVLPGLAFTAEYHFIGLLDPLPAFQLEQSRYVNVRLPCSTQNCAFAVTRQHIEVEGNRHFGNDFNHEIVLGFRYALFQPRNPMAPGDVVAIAPPPVPAGETRSYLVFFDWDRADLTARARQIVSAAAQSAQHQSVTRIEVNGYTDLSGTAAYNQRLSVRRATSVKAELVRDGVAAGEIGIHGYGETNPLVPTQPGTREPQNRRVEIILR